MLLTYSKIGVFACFLLSLAYLKTHMSIVHSMLNMLGMCLITLFISWQSSGILTRWLQSRSRLKGFTADGKCILITGCDTGFGHAIALHLNSVGYTVFAGCLFADGSQAQSLLLKARHKGNMKILQLDVRSQQDIDDALTAVKQHEAKTGQRLFTLINNAAVSGWAPLEWGSMKQDIEPIIRVNLDAVIKMTETFLPLLQRTARLDQSGLHSLDEQATRVMFMTSYVTHFSVPFIAPYVVSKCGVKAYASALRAELDRDPGNRLKVLTIEPTAYKTNLLGYDVVSGTMQRAWDRTEERVKQSYGYTLFDALKHFLTVCQFFEFFEFLTIRTDLTEVARVIEDLLIQQDALPDTAVMSWPSFLMQRFFLNYSPDEGIETFFRFLAAQLMIFAFEVSLIKSLFRT